MNYYDNEQIIQVYFETMDSLYDFLFYTLKLQDLIVDANEYEIKIKDLEDIPCLQLCSYVNQHECAISTYPIKQLVKCRALFNENHEYILKYAIIPQNRVIYFNPFFVFYRHKGYLL